MTKGAAETYKKYVFGGASIGGIVVSSIDLISAFLLTHFKKLNIYFVTAPKKQPTYVYCSLRLLGN